VLSDCVYDSAFDYLIDNDFWYLCSLAEIMGDDFDYTIFQ